MPEDSSYFQKGPALKLDSKPIPLAALTLTVLSMTACGTPQVKDEAPAGACRPDAATALTGRNGVSDAEARRLTGASIVRQVQPGQPVTMDYRRERVTIETDPKTGKIVRAYCG